MSFRQTHSILPRMDKDRRVGLVPIPDIDKAVEAFMQKNSRMAIEILRNGSPVQRTRFFQTAIESLADGIMSRKVSPRSLSSRMKELITLDGTKDSYDNESHARVRNALTKLDDDKAIKFSEMLSHQIAIKLRCFDLEYCDERIVRKRIANAVITDILDLVGSVNVPSRLEKYRANISRGLANAIGKLNDLPRNEAGTVIEKLDMTDSVTGIKFSTRVRREERGWVSEEVRPDGSPISQAKIGDGGESILTLDFQEKRYKEKGANPQILGESGFPTGTKVLFLNHAASLGVISWSGK